MAKLKAVTTKEVKNCLACHELTTDYYKSRNDLFAESVCVCKPCARLYVESGDREKIALLCQTLNVPFIAEEFAKAFDSNEDTLGTYMRYVNASGMRDKKFKDSNLFTAVEQKRAEAAKPAWAKSSDIDIDNIDVVEMEIKYGLVVDALEYVKLEKIYYANGGTYATDEADKADIVNYAIMDYQAKKCLSEGGIKEYNDLTKTAISKKKEIQKNLDNKGKGEELLPMLAKKIEMTRPIVSMIDYGRQNFFRAFVNDFVNLRYKEVMGELSEDDSKKLLEKRALISKMNKHLEEIEVDVIEQFRAMENKLTVEERAIRAEREVEFSGDDIFGV